MKNIIKFLGLLAIVISLSSCEEKQWLQPDIELVPVYSITNIEGVLAPFQINIYQEQPLIIEYQKEDNAESFQSTDFTDTSTENMYEISVNKLDDEKVITYVVSADKQTGVGTLVITNAGVETSYTIIVANTELYN